MIYDNRFAFVTPCDMYISRAAGFRVFEIILFTMELFLTR